MTDRKTIRVRDVMKTEFDMVEGLVTVSEALSTMKHVDTKSIIINKRHQTDEFGMLLVSDIARQVLAKDKSPDRVNVYEIMTKPVITIDPEMDIRYCSRLFSQFNLSRAPVIEEGNVIGIVSLTDMVMNGMCADVV